MGPSAGAAASTNVAEWRAAVCEGAALVADVMDRQTEVLGELANEVSGLRQAVECLSSSSASSLQGAMSGGDTGQESVWGGDEDEEMKEGEEMWVDGEMVKLRMHGDEESGGAEEDEDEGGKHDEEDEEEGDDEEGDEEGDTDEGGGDDEEEDREEKGADDKGGAEPEASTALWWPHIPHPKMKVWKDKGKVVEKGKGKGKGKMY